MRDTVVVSGCSTGIGLAVAVDLAEHGYDVLAGVRTDEDAARLSRLSPHIRPAILDVTEQRHLAGVRDAAAGSRIVGLINNAGITAGGPVEHLPVEDFNRVLHVNVLGAVSLTQALLPSLRAARGRVIFMGSLTARMPLPFLAPYAASKAALAAISTCLRLELREQGLHVSLIEPASVPSAIWDKGRAQIDCWSSDGYDATYPQAAAQLHALVQREASAGRSFAPIADAVRHALTAQRPRPRYLVGAEARGVALAAVLPQVVRDSLTAAFIRGNERRTIGFRRR
jgi:short-subunit dehydrogenase